MSLSNSSYLSPPLDLILHDTAEALPTLLPLTTEKRFPWPTRNIKLKTLCQQVLNGLHSYYIQHIIKTILAHKNVYTERK
jgi:hypothetical protein